MRIESFPVATYRTVRLRRGRRVFTSAIKLRHRSLALLRAPTEAEFPVAVELELGRRGETFRSLDGEIYRKGCIRSVPASSDGTKDCVYDEKSGLFRSGLVPGSSDEPFRSSHVGPAFLGAVRPQHWQSPFLPGVLPGDVLSEEADAAGYRTVDDGVAQADARVAAIASRMALFGDRLWLAVGEPIWRAEPGGVGLAFPSPDGEPDGFRLDRHEGASDAARVRDGRPVVTSGRVVFVEPSLLRYDERIALARFIAVNALAVEAEHVQLLPSDGVGTLLRLRRLVAQGMPATPQAAKGLVEAASAYLAVLDRLGLNDLGRGLAPLPRDIVGAALARWEGMAPSILDEEDEDALAGLGEP